MSVLTLQTFLGNHDLQALQDYSAQLLSGIGGYEVLSSNNEELTKLNNLFVDVYQILKPSIEHFRLNNQILENNSAISDNKDSNHVLSSIEKFKLDDNDIKLFLNAINEIESNNWLTSADANVSGLAKIILLYISISILSNTCNDLIDSTLTTLNDINYYDCILSKKYSVVLYFIQNLPLNIYDFLRNLNLKLTNTSASTNSNIIINVPTWVPDFFENTYTTLVECIELTYRLVNKSIEGFITSPTTFLLEKKNTSTSYFKTFWNSTFNIPYYYSKFEIESKRKNLVRLQKKNVTKLGYLLSHMTNYEIKDNEIAIDISIIRQISDLLNSDNYESSSEKFEVKSLYDLIHDGIPHFLSKNRQIEIKNSRPSYFTRNWPIIIPSTLFVISYVPSTFRNINLLLADSQVRYEFYEYLASIFNYAIDTVGAFYKNWIIGPINNILNTIRHDDNSKIAIMTQKSLESDLDSLERMIIAYATDSNESSTIDISKLQESIKLGDMTLIMNDYEKDLKTPIKSILIGDMLRNIMIQIQKTKVDGSLALNGVDKILKSQELVFGFVAASPSLLILYMIKNSFMSWYNGDSNNYNREVASIELKGRICKSLGIIERLIDFIIIGERKGIKGNDDYYKTGLLFIEVKNLKRLAKVVLPPYIYKNFINDLDEILDQNLDTEYKLLAIQRIWNVYGRYFS